MLDCRRGPLGSTQGTDKHCRVGSLPAEVGSHAAQRGGAMTSRWVSALRSSQRRRSDASDGATGNTSTRTNKVIGRSPRCSRCGLARSCTEGWKAGGPFSEPTDTRLAAGLAMLRDSPNVDLFELAAAEELLPPQLE
jgi:hypothetical protein